jgi:hypothetical protein
VRYAPARWVGIDEGGGVDFGGDAWGGPNDGMGLVLVLGATAGKGFVEVVASSEIVWRTYVGYGPRPAKSLCTMSSNSLSVNGSTFSSSTHLLLHLADLPQTKHPLPNYTPRLIHILADNLRGDHEHRYE